jgi:hypothetical protein
MGRVTKPVDDGESSDFIPFQHSPWGTYRDAMAHCKYSRAHIEKAVYSGHLQTIGEGKGRRFNREWVDDWMRRGAPVPKVAEPETAGVA